MGTIRHFSADRFWTNIEDLITARGLDYRDVTKALGRNDNFISRCKIKGTCPTASDALALADFFGVSVEDLAFDYVYKQLRRSQLEAELKKIEAELEELDR